MQKPPSQKKSAFELFCDIRNKIGMDSSNHNSIICDYIHVTANYSHNSMNKYLLIILTINHFIAY